MSSFENVGLESNPKENEGYLSQIANNPDEKIGELVDTIIESQLLKTSDGRSKNNIEYGFRGFAELFLLLTKS